MALIKSLTNRIMRLKRKLHNVYYGIDAAPHDLILSLKRKFRFAARYSVKYDRKEAALYDNVIQSHSINDILFFTFADWKYHVFAALYPVFALTTNDNSCVEICLSEFDLFMENYRNIIDFYNQVYPGRVFYRSVKVSDIFPNSVRFLLKPEMTAKYVYIGDVDILLLERNIEDYHIEFMKKYDSDFSNVLRNENQLTGLHFMEYEKMYPVKIPRGADLLSMNDEVLLCSMMREKQCKFPPLGIPLSERKTHGMHISMLSRPPLRTLTTHDRQVNFPAWTISPNAAKYLEIRYSTPVVEFMQCISENQIKLRQVIQTADMFAYYRLKEQNYSDD